MPSFNYTLPFPLGPVIDAAQLDHDGAGDLVLEHDGAGELALEHDGATALVFEGEEAMGTFHAAVGNTKLVEFTLKEPEVDGVRLPVSIPAEATVHLRAVKQGAEALKFDLACTVVEPDAPTSSSDCGRCTLLLTPAQLDEAGYFRLEARITYEDDAVEDFPNDRFHTLVVREAITTP